MPIPDLSVVINDSIEARKKRDAISDGRVLTVWVKTWEAC
jgi:hypothetical protein